MNVTLDLKTSNDAGGFEGYGSVFYRLDRHGDIILPGAFKKSLPAFLKEGFVGGVGHKHDAPVGRFTDAYEDDHGLFVKARFSDVPNAHTTRTLIADGVVQKLSVGIDVKQFEYATRDVVERLWAKAGYTPDDNDRFRLDRVKKVRLITEADVKEISPVTIPSNDDARIMSYKSFGQTPPEFQRFITTGRVAMYRLAVIDTKAGRVLSGKNETKLRAMLEVLTSVSEELNNLLALVATAPEINDDDAQPDDPNATGGSDAEADDADTADDDADKSDNTDQRKIEDDEEFARRRGADKKSGVDQIQTKMAALALAAFAESI